jgi:hypothetical protein
MTELEKFMSQQQSQVYSLDIFHRSLQDDIDRVRHNEWFHEQLRNNSKKWWEFWK